MPLEQDNKSHRGFSDNLDRKYGGGPKYEKYVRPVVHGAYHVGRGVTSLNSAEIARAKDQFTAVGHGQPRSEYLKAHKAAEKKEAEKKS